jgi:hypothetical protein
VFFHDLNNFFFFEFSSGDIELTYALGDNWLLTLDLKIKFNIGLLGHLDWFGAHLFAASFELLYQLLTLVTSNHAKNKALSNKNNTFLQLLELLSKLRKERKVKSGRLMLRLHVVELGVPSGVDDKLDLKV